MAVPTPPDAAKEIEFVRSLVAKHFPVYDVKVSYDVVQFFCRVDETTLEESFEYLREEMAPHNYIPMITYDKGEHVVMVAKKPPAKYRSIYVNVAMLIITFLAMMFAGILDWSSYADVPGDQMYSIDNILTGIAVFTLPLMAILGVHELGHFFMARKRRVAASLPFFIPSIPPLGTFGAFISLRDPIPNRKSLLEIGVAGPLAGLAVAIPIAILGLMLTNAEARPVPDDLGEGGLVRVSFPLIYLWLEQLTPLEGDYLLHPTAFAAWVGFLVTALNLLPAGQLDGGHIARALLGSKAKYASWVTIAALIAISFYFLSWLFFAILILFLGARHPPPLNDITGLDIRRKAVGAFAFVILVIAFVPVPMAPVTVDASFSMTALDDTNRTIVPGEHEIYQIQAENLGNTRNNISFEEVVSPVGWEVLFKLEAAPDSDYASDMTILLNLSANETITVRIASAPSTLQGNMSVTIRGISLTGGDDEESAQRLTFNFTVELPALSYWVPEGIPTVAAGSSCNVTVRVNNTNPAAVNATLTVTETAAYTGAVLYLFDAEDPETSAELNLTIPANGNATFYAEVFVWPKAELGEITVVVEITMDDILIGTIRIPIMVV